MNDGSFVAIGRIVRTHGLNGEVSVAPATEASLADLIGVTVWFAPPPAGVRSGAICSVRSGPKGPLVALAGIDSVDAASSIRGAELLVRREQLPESWLQAPAEDDSYEGYGVFDVRHGSLGEIVETIITGANDVWVVEGRFGEVLVPVIDDVVRSVDEDARTVEVCLLDGLLPGTEEEA